jgi:HK97 family phage prohead protease
MKNYNLYKTKEALELKDIDSKNRQVAMYLARFDNIDSDMDLIRKGAFKKSIRERGVKSKSNRKIAFLRHHDWQQQIGKFVELSEDDNGLYAVAELGRSTAGEDALKDYEDGIIREHSIGFQYVSGKMKWIEDTTIETNGFNEVKEVRLWEGSAVTFGSNELTPVVEMKGVEKSDFIEKITNELDVCVTALVNGRGTDERLHEIEMKIKFLNSQLVLLAETDPIQLDQSGDHKPAPQVIKKFDWNKVVKSLQS